MTSTYVPFKLNKDRDADILAAIADAPDRSARLRELIRLGLTVLRNTSESPKGVTRNTKKATEEPEMVLRNTSEPECKPMVDERPEPPAPIPAEHSPAGSGNGRVLPKATLPLESDPGYQAFLKKQQRTKEAQARLSRPEPGKKTE